MHAALFSAHGLLHRVAGLLQAAALTGSLITHKITGDMRKSAVLNFQTWVLHNPLDTLIPYLDEVVSDTQGLITSEVLNKDKGFKAICWSI